MKEKAHGHTRESQRLHSTTFHLNGHRCFSRYVFVFNVSAPEGEIVFDRLNSESDNSSNQIGWNVNLNCIINITVPAHLLVQATVEEMIPCQKHAILKMDTVSVICRRKTPAPFLLSSTRNMELSVSLFAVFVRIRFQGVRTHGLTEMPVHFSSSSSGFITSPLYNGINRFQQRMKVQQDLTIPEGHAVMISFQHFAIIAKGVSCLWVKVKLYIMRWSKDNPRQHWAKCNERIIPVDLFEDIYGLRLFMSSDIPFSHFGVKNPILTGFKMLFSFHTKGDVPAKLKPGLFNCSETNYSSFQHHLHCNLLEECFEGQDETGSCPYSSEACQGKVASRGKCFYYDPAESRPHSNSYHREFQGPGQFCKAEGGRLATVRSPAELKDFMRLFQYGKQRSVTVLTGMAYAANDLSMPDMYRHMARGHDKSILYYRVDSSFKNKFFTSDTLYMQYYAYAAFKTFGYAGAAKLHNKLDAVCEVDTSVFKSSNKSNRVAIHQTQDVTRVVSRAKQHLVQCPDGHVTHAVFKCDLWSSCGQENHATCEIPHVVIASQPVLPLSPTMHGEAMLLRYFECDNGATVPFSIVCDYRPDCQDESDESFCKHPPCRELFSCRNRQCVTLEERCNTLSDCLDNSDEMECAGYREHSTVWQTAPQNQSIIDLDGKGSFVARRLQANETCPQTHYRCLGELAYCLPVYTRCNGYYDCLDREDEQGCEQATCPGFYRCRKSSVCVHPDHLCDGWPQCPQRDDEWLCEMTCPAGCVCVGRTARCPQHVSAALEPQLRQLDARGSGLTPAMIIDSWYLIRADFRNCSIAHLADVLLSNPNLQFMDLSHNSLKTINLSTFLDLQNLRDLILSNNPVSSLYHQPVAANQDVLRRLDLSNTELQVLDSRQLRYFPNLQQLNLSHTEIHSITGSGLQPVQKLRELDIEMSPLKYFPSDIFQGLITLRMVKSDNYKLCCKDIYPQVSHRNCYAPQDEISSCEDLLRTEVYRSILWVVAVLSVMGNLFCFFIRVCVFRNAAKGSYNVFVTNLSLADLFMGLYMAIIGVADKKFQGQYLHYEEIWTRSGSCKLAGFLSLLSSEMSALSIWLITLDRFIVLRFPFTDMRFGTTSASVACLLAWLISFCIAAVPLLPGLSQWQFYSQSGICIPLPITRRQFPGRGYSFGILIVFNFTIFLFIAIGQGFIYHTVKASSMKGSTSHKTRDTTVAHRLLIVAVTDFLCWFPISLCGLLAGAGVPIPGEVNVAFAILVLPLNSAVNPFLYTINAVLQKSDKLREDRMVEQLRQRLAEEKDD